MQYRYLVIWVTLLFSLAVQVMPWPKGMIYLQPNWVFLTLFYWALMLPDRVNIGVAFFMGCVLDLIMGAALGIRALALCSMVYLLSFRFQSMRNLRLWQQVCIVIVLSAIYSLFVFYIEYLINSSIMFLPQVFLSALINGIIWPWYFLLLHFIQNKFHLY